MFKIPKSKIKTGLYTADNKYIYKKSKNFYKGDYYKYNGKFYAGKTFNPDEIPTEIEEANKIKYTSNDFLYDVLAGIKQGVGPISNSPVRNKAAVLTSIQLANQQGFTSEVGINNDADINAINAYQEEQVASSTTTTRKRYFYRQTYSLNKADAYKFGEVKTEDDYDLLTKRPNYITASITETRIPGQAPFLDEKELNDAEVKMPGLKKFLETQPQTSAEIISTPSSTATSTATTTSSAPASTGGGGGASTSSGGGGGGGGMITTGAGSNLISGPPSRLR
jgi:hypothetical protein